MDIYVKHFTLKSWIQNVQQNFIQSSNEHYKSAVLYLHSKIR